MPNVNVLVADHQNSCAFYLKSVLSPQGFGVSLSFDAAQTMAKISTGLFDAVVCSFDLTDPGASGLIMDINALVPGMPVVVVRKMGQPEPVGLDIHGVLTLPLSVKSVVTIMDGVHDIVTSPENRRRYKRKKVNLPAEITAGGRKIFCKATNLSAGGLQVETIHRSKLRKGLEALFSDPQSGPVLARLFVDKNRIMEFEANLAYVERFRFRAPEQIGLAFAKLTEDQRKSLNRYLVEVG